MVRPMQLEQFADEEIYRQAMASWTGIRDRFMPGPSTDSYSLFDPPEG